MVQMCRAVRRPVNTVLVTMIHSWHNDNGYVFFTTNKPSFEIEAIFKYLLTPLLLVSFLDGLVPCDKFS